MNEDTQALHETLIRVSNIYFSTAAPCGVAAQRCQVNTVAAAVRQEPTGPVSRLAGAKQETRRDETRVKSENSEFTDERSWRVQILACNLRSHFSFAALCPRECVFGCVCVCLCAR